MKSPIHFAEILAHPRFEVSVFFLQKGARLPLHDHPGMAVYSKILYGSLKITSFDWTLDEAVPRSARLYQDKILSADSGVYALLPDHGNLHMMEAVEDVAFIDVLTPPYDSLLRPCTYYKIVRTCDDMVYLLPCDSNVTIDNFHLNTSIDLAQLWQK